MLNVFHISDLHFTSESEGLRRDYSQAASSAILRLARELKAQGVLGSSPIVAITGDLVQRGDGSLGDTNSDFDAVQSQFLEPLLESLGVGPDRLVIVPGNHEMDMGAVSQGDYLNSRGKCSEADVNKDLATKLDNFINFAEINGYQTIGRENPRFAIFKIDGQSIICLNGLAGSYSRPGFGDKGELFLLPTELSGALANLDDFPIVLSHHPLSWFCDESELRLRDFLASKRSRLLTGHIHNDGIGEVLTEKGNFVTLQAGASSDAGDIRFAVAVTWFSNSNGAATRLYRYDDREARFSTTSVEETKVAPAAATAFFKRSEAFFDPGIVQSVAAAAKRASARELFVTSGGNADKFVAPDLTHFKEDQFSGKRVSVDSVATDQGNVMISGFELSGKSSLIAYLCYMFSNDTNEHSKSTVGLFLDFREFSKSDSIFELIIKRLSEFGIASQQIEYILSIGKVRLFVDNFDANDRLVVKRFLEVSEKYNLVRWTCAARGSERFMPSRAPSDFEGSDVSYDVTPNLHPVAIRASASLLRMGAGEARGCVA